MSVNSSAFFALKYYRCFLTMSICLAAWEMFISLSRVNCKFVLFTKITNNPSVASPSSSLESELLSFSATTCTRPPNWWLSVLSLFAKANQSPHMSSLARCVSNVGKCLLQYLLKVLWLETAVPSPSVPSILFIRKSLWFESYNGFHPFSLQ